MTKIKLLLATTILGFAGVVLAGPVNVNTADAETIAVAIDIFRACGLEDSQFQMTVNHRDLLNSFISSIIMTIQNAFTPIYNLNML